MQKKKLLLAIVVFIGTAIVFPFNNCSQVAFDTSQGVDGLNKAEGSPDLGTPPPPEEIPPTEIAEPGEEPPSEPPRPIVDVEMDPSLLDKYVCPDNPDEVQICHFPSSFEKRHTICVGRPAVKSHYGHVVAYQEDGVEKIASDYLGPCR